MKVGGPLRGWNRAVRITIAYCFHYFIVGAIVSVGMGFFIGPRHNRHEVIMMLLFSLFWICALIVPTATAANLLFVRLFPKRTWRNDRRRPWIAAALGVVLTGGGMLLLEAVKPPWFLGTLGREEAGCLFYVGWFVLLSNLALLGAWALPGKKG